MAEIVRYPVDVIEKLKIKDALLDAVKKNENVMRLLTRSFQPKPSFHVEVKPYVVGNFSVGLWGGNSHVTDSALLAIGAEVRGKEVITWHTTDYVDGPWQRSSQAFHVNFDDMIAFVVERLENVLKLRYQEELDGITDQ
jgi:hypothetical protein